MSQKKRKPKTKRSGAPGHKRPTAPAAPATELVFDRIGKPEIDRILREQIGMTLAAALERSSVPSVQAFVDELEHEDDAVLAVQSLEAELGIEAGVDELPELDLEQDVRLLRADIEQQAQIGEVDKRLLTICREAMVSLERRAIRAEKELEQAVRRTEQAETQAARHERRAEERVAESQELRGKLEAAESEIAELQARLAKARAKGERLEHELEDVPDAPVDGGDAQATIDDLRKRLKQREELLIEAHAEHERLEISLDVARNEVIRLHREAEGTTESAVAAEEELPEVETVLEAVREAQKRCKHLVFTERSIETAEDSPFWRPDMVLADLIKLDKVAEAYERPEGIGQPVGQYAQDLGLDWRSGVGEVWYGIHPNDYHFSHDGHTLRVAEHVRVANGSGAQRCARVYCAFHPGSDAPDDLPRGVYVGPVGRKLPDSTTG
jgi:chromosome segregation ATPase